MSNKKLVKQNQHIEDYLNAYRKMDDVDFAVMITGPWGCGKTHFINQYLDENCISGDQKEYLYISLNGVAQTSDIDMALFQAAHPVLGSKLAVTAGKIFKASLKAGLKVDLDINGDDKPDASARFDIPLDSFKLTAKSKFLVFDDLERCLLKPSEVLGYINAFVESKEAKVLVVGDERHFGINLLDAQKDDDSFDKTDQFDTQKDTAKYWMIKEKVVGKTFRLTERIVEIFDALISEDIYPQTYGLIVRNKDRVIQILQSVSKDTKKYNYRALKHGLRDFEYFYPHIELTFRGNDAFVNDLFKVFLALAYEIQLGNLSPDEFLSGDPAKEYAKIIARDTDKKEEESNFDKILKRHEFLCSAMTPSLSNLIFLPELWIQIFSNDWINQQEVSEAIKNSSYFPKKRSEWVDLWYWRRSEDDAATKALEEVRKKIEDHAYISYEIVMHVFSILLGLADEGAITDSKDDIFSEARVYLAYLVDQGVFQVPEKKSGWHWANHGSHSLEYWTHGDDRQKMIDIIDAAIARVVKQKRVESVDSWLEDLQHFNGQFLTDIGTNGKYSQEPVLQYFDSDKFIKVLEDMPNSQKFLVGSIFEKRYEYWAEKLVKELPFWKAVLEILKKKLDEHTGLITPSYRNMEQVKKNIESIVGVLRNASGQRRDLEEK